MRASWPSLIALALAGCGGGAPPIEVIAGPPPIEAPAPAPGPRDTVSSADAGCWAGDASASPTPVGARSLDVDIQQAQERILEAQYQDVGALVRLSRLQLMRDQREPNLDGPNDAERSRKNAMRGIAVMDAPETRAALSVAVAYWLESPTPDVRARLVGALIAQTKGAAGFSEAVTKVLEGYALLDRGDPAAARLAFEAATRADPGVASGFVGLGDAARARRVFDEAIHAYGQAGAILPADTGIARSLEAARRGEALGLPEETAFGRALSLSLEPLVSGGAGAMPCSSYGAAEIPENLHVCAGLASLRGASTVSELERGAMKILEGWRGIEDACVAHEPACGPHVAAALREAARAFRLAGMPAKAISMDKILLKHTPLLPGSEALAGDVRTELGDLYASIGVLDQAAGFYETAGSALATERALMLRLGMGEVESALDMVTKATREKSVSVSDRSRWVALVAAALAASQRSGSARKWLERHDALLREPGASTQVADLLAMRPPRDRSGFMRCAARRLAGETGWAQAEDTLRRAHMR